ncbi:crosslink repair DNA glycosylase YcaQ family protein [Micromonospora sp. M12]
MTVLDRRALNRATLARQLLLDRAEMPVLDAVAHLGGLQAQEPQEPFVGLWSRLRAFDPAVLSTLLTQRHLVRGHLMRRTVHLLVAGDAVPGAPATTRCCVSGCSGSTAASSTGGPRRPRHGRAGAAGRR